MKFSKNILFGVFIFLVWEFCSAKLDDEFELFKIKFSRKYQNSTEELNRKLQFQKTDREIVKHNQEYDEGKQLYKMSHNQFSDRFTDEKNKILMKVNYKNHTSKKRNRRQLPTTPTTVPNSLNWVEKGWNTPVQNQGECGSCYAFTTVGTIEAAYFIKNRVHIKLSEQDIIDCSTRYGNNGCIDGDLPGTFKYVRDLGVSLNAVYPYKEKLNKSCLKTGPQTHIIRYHWLQNQSENTIRDYVATYGPVAVAFNAKRNFLRHTRGIYHDRNCDTTKKNHALIIVGYGTERRTDYWIVKNSIGTQWGEQGYAKIRRNINQCGIANEVLFPHL